MRRIFVQKMNADLTSPKHLFKIHSRFDFSKVFFFYFHQANSVLLISFFIEITSIKKIKSLKAEIISLDFNKSSLNTPYHMNPQEPKKAPVKLLFNYAVIGLAGGASIFATLNILHHRRLPSFIPVESIMI